MAQKYNSSSFGTLVKPGAYVDQKVQKSNAGTATTGVLVLIGEAEGGPDVASDDLSVNYFGPDQLGDVVAKYKSGTLVEAFNMATSASGDEDIRGSFTRAYLVKTNISGKASGALLRSGLASSWSSLADFSFGQIGNLINFSVSGSAEAAPSTGLFTYIWPTQSSSLKLRVNGSTALTLSLPTNMLPSALVGNASVAASLNGLSLGGIHPLHATGGIDRGTISVGMVGGVNISLTASGNNVLIAISTGSWAVTPSIGDTLIIPVGSAIDGGGGNQNAGAYVVSAASSNTVSATKLANDVSGALTTLTVGATPIAAISDMEIFSPINVENMTGTERSILTGLVGQTVAGTATGSQLTLTLQTGSVWAALPQAGDKLLISDTAPVAWKASGANLGWFSVVSATSGTAAGASKITLTRLSNGNPSSFSATAIVAVTDFRVLKPAIDGVGKSLEIFDGSGDLLSAQFFNLNTSPVSWISTATSPKMMISAAEYAATVSASRSFDNIQESFVGSGSVVLRVGYYGGGDSSITGSMTISGTTLSTAVTGGNGVSLSGATAINLLNFKTLGDLATYINSLPGYIASVSSTLFGQLALNYKDANGASQTVLDKGTFGIASHLVASGSTISPAGRVKREAWYLWDRISDSAFVKLGSTTISLAPSSGQPEAQALSFMAGGSKGGTTNAQIITALAKAQYVRGNFIVSLFSRDATEDYFDAMTDSTSTYTIDSINGAVKNHVLAMSVIKRRRHRQGLVSVRTSFANAKLAATNLANSRMVMTFQDFRLVDTSGNLTQFQPWAGAVLAASMQAAGFYKPIVKKFINCSGVLMADGSYSDQELSDVEDALEHGLLPAEEADTGGFSWVSDQTTYSVDENPFYNSLQAVYAMDTIALTIASRMERAFVGQSLADVGAGVLRAYLQGIMRDILRLKLIAPSDGFSSGFANDKVKIVGPAAEVSVDCFLAGGLYFIPITTTFNQVVQTAG